MKLLPGLEPAPGEPIVTKTSHNAFTTTNLAQVLVERRASNLVITGIRTEQCCETTTRVTSDLGYGVRFVLDATATEPLTLWDGSGTLTACEVKERTASASHARQRWPQEAAARAVGLSDARMLRRSRSTARHR